VGDPQDLVDPRELGLGLVDEEPPELLGFVVALLELPEPLPRLVPHAGVGLGLGVDPRVDVREDLHLVFALLEPLLGLVGPALPGGDHEAELGAPVAQVVDADHGVAQPPEDLPQAPADHGRAQVPQVERLRDVRRGEVDHDRLARALVGPAVVGVGPHRGQDLLGDLRRVEAEVDEGAGGLGRHDHAAGDLLGELGGQAQGAVLAFAAEGVGDLEAGQGQVAPRGVLGRLQLGGDLLHGDVDAGGDAAGDFLDEAIHGLGLRVCRRTVRARRSTIFECEAGADGQPNRP
jgi:hypothetical protein